MIFWWGIQNKINILDSGAFFCPECACDRQFSFKEVRRYFAIYSIPFLPLDLVGKYIECNECKEQFHPSLVDDTYVEEHEDTLWQRFKGNMANILSLVLVVASAFSTGIYLFHTPEKISLHDQAGFYKPAKVVVGNGSNKTQKVFMAWGNTFDSLDLKPGEMATFDVLEESYVTLAVGKKSQTMMIDNPEMVTLAYITGDLSLECKKEPCHKHPLLT
jgi:hypothetical protein